MTDTTAVVSLDAQIREAETDCFGHYGVSRTEEYVDLDSGLGRQTVRLQVFGEATTGVPPIVLLHGVGSNQAMAAPLLPYLVDRQVIAVDWPGHGLSGECVLPGGVNLRGFVVRIMDSLLDEIGEHRVDLIGHSLGAQFSIYTALDLTPHVRRVVLLGAPGAAFAGTKPATMMKVMALPAVGTRLLGTRMSEKQYIKANEDYILGPQAFSDVPRSMITVGRLMSSRPGNAASIASYFRTLIRGNRVRSGVAVDADELAQLNQPFLLVWGDLDVFNTPAVAARSIVAIRDSRLVRLPDAGHAPWLHNIKAVGSVVAEHIAP